MGQLVGYGMSGTDYDFYLYDRSGRVWASTGWVFWEDADYLAYRLAATESSPGRFVAEVPAGAAGGLAWTELRFSGPTLVASYVVFTDDDCAAPAASAPGDPGQILDGILAADILEAAKGPQSMMVDGQQAVSHPLPHLIEADKYLSRKKTAKNRGFWGQLTIAKMIPPAAVDET